MAEKLLTTIRQMLTCFQKWGKEAKEILKVTRKQNKEVEYVDEDQIQET